MNTPTIALLSPIITSGAYLGTGSFNLIKTTFALSYNTSDGVYDAYRSNAANSIVFSTGLAPLTSPEAGDVGKIATGFQDSPIYKAFNVACFTRDILFSGGTSYSNRIFFGTDSQLWIQNSGNVWAASPDGGITWTVPSSGLPLPIRAMR